MDFLQTLAWVVMLLVFIVGGTIMLILAVYGVIKVIHEDWVKRPRRE